MNTYSIVVGLAIFLFDENEQINFKIGMTRTDNNMLVLPSTLWCDSGTLEATAKHLLRTSVYADENWLDVEEVGNIELIMNKQHCAIMSLWRTYVPHTVETNKEIEWIEYGQLENLNKRILGHNLKALRRAFNR